MFHVSAGTSLSDKRRRLPKGNLLKLLLVLLMDASPPSWSFWLPDQQRATQTASEPRQDPPPSFSRQSQGAWFNNNYSKRVLLYFFPPFIVLSVFAGQQGGMCPGSLLGRWSRNTPTNKKALQASPHLYVYKKLHRESRNAAASDVKNAHLLNHTVKNTVCSVFIVVDLLEKSWIS